MKILHVITSLHMGGAEKIVIELISNFKLKGIQVDLLIFNSEVTPLYKEAERLDINLIKSNRGKSVYSIFHFIRLRKISKNYDIIHTHNTAPQFFGALCARFSSKIFITTEHGGSNRRRKIKLFKFLDKWMYRQYNKVICISSKAKDNLENFLGCPLDNVKIINNGINLNKIYQSKPERILESLAPNSKKIVMVAGFRWEKDHPTLIKSLKFLPSNFNVFLIGDGIRRKEFEDLSKFEKVESRVHFLGIRNDVGQILKEADFIVLASHFEGLSLSSIEALSSGKPFLASDVDGLREIVSGCGILFPPGDFEALAKEILELDNDPMKIREISKLCLLKSHEFDIEKTVENYYLLYKNTMYNQK